MKPIYIFSSIIAVVVIATGAIWYVGTKNSAPEVKNEPVVLNTTEATSDDIVAADGSFSGSVYDLAKSGKAYECTVNHTVQGISSKGIVHVFGDNIKADFTSTVPILGSIKTTMIADADSVYTWTSMMNQGFKSARGVAAISVNNKPQSVDLNQTLNYNCVSWTADMSIFTLPTTITFKTV